MQKVYMAVTSDKYELPVAVADSTGQLAVITGVGANAIRSHISHKLNGTKRGIKYVIVRIPDDSEEPDDEDNFKR